MPEELAALIETAQSEGEVHEERVIGRSFWTGTLGGTPVVLARSGVGKVAAAMTATLLCERADSMVMVGTAGGLGDAVHPGDVVVADRLLQHDVDARPLLPRWQVDGVVDIEPDARLSAALADSADDVVARHRSDLADLGIAEPRRHTGLIVSGDVFVGSALASKELREALPHALAVEMEGAALAQVCRSASVPFAVARTVSDRADDAASVDFRRFVEDVAAPYARAVVRGMLSRLA